MNVRLLKSPILIIGLIFFFTLSLKADEEKIFRTLDQIQNNIKEKNLDWTAGKTSVSDIPWEEFQSTHLRQFESDGQWDNLPKADLISIEKAILKSEVDRSL